MYTKEDGWWKDNNMVAIVVKYMCEQGHDPSEVARVVQKPWNYSDELNQAIAKREELSHLSKTSEVEEDQCKFLTARHGQGNKSGLGRNKIAVEDIYEELCKCGPDCDCKKCMAIKSDSKEIDER